MCAARCVHVCVCREVKEASYAVQDDFMSDMVKQMERIVGKLQHPAHVSPPPPSPLSSHHCFCLLARGACAIYVYAHCSPLPFVSITSLYEQAPEQSLRQVQMRLHALARLCHSPPIK